MAKVEKTISINAPVEKVFSYVNEPTNLPEIWANYDHWGMMQQLGVIPPMGQGGE